jgi:hypothetical protein
MSSYARFVASGLSKITEPVVHRQIFIGRKRFVATMARRLHGKTLDEEIPLVQRRPCPPTIEDICAAVSGEWKVPVGALARRRAGEPRVAAIYLATRLAGVTAREVGAAFGVKRGRVSNVISDVEKGRCRSLRGRLRALEDFLKSETERRSEILLPP